MKHNKYIIVVILMIVPILGFSQKWKLSRSEYILGVGISNYFGDIGGAANADASRFADMDISYTRPVLAVGYRYKLYEQISIKGNLSYASLHGSDISSVNEGRNFAFTTNLFELNGQFEYHIIKEKQVVSYKVMSMRGKLQKFNAGINLYAFLGVGASYFKTKAEDGLAEGDRADEFAGNKNLAVVFPVGLGLKYPLSSTTFVGLELGAHFTTSDYVDGYTSLSSESKDMYYFTVINVSTKIKRSNRRKEYRF